MNKHHRTYGPRIRAYLLLAAAIILAGAPLPAAAAELDPPAAGGAFLTGASRLFPPRSELRLKQPESAQ